MVGYQASRYFPIQAGERLNKKQLLVKYFGTLDQELRRVERAEGYWWLLGVNKCFMHRFSQFNASPGPARHRHHAWEVRKFLQIR